jgi:hypothetical protein
MGLGQLPPFMLSNMCEKFQAVFGDTNLHGKT